MFISLFNRQVDKLSRERPASPEGLLIKELPVLIRYGGELVAAGKALGCRIGIDWHIHDGNMFHLQVIERLGCLG